MSLSSVLSFLEDLPIYKLEQQTYNGRYCCGDLLPCWLDVEDVDETLVNTEEVDVQIQELYLESRGEMLFHYIVLVDISFLK